MNVYTFKDAATSKRQSLAHELETLDDREDDEDEEAEEGEGAQRAAPAGAVEGEEDESGDKFNEAGEVIMPFNLKDERDDGNFDEGGNYVWRKEKEEPDAWLANMDEAAMENAIGEAAAALKRKNDNLEKLNRQEDVVHDRETLKADLLTMLIPGETIPTALRRLGGGKAGRPKGGGKQKAIPQPPAADKEAFAKLTDIADALIVLGYTNIYDLPYDAMDAILSVWEYQGQDGEVYGPYPGDQIAKWMQQGFFDSSSIGAGVQMRKVLGGGSGSAGRSGLNSEGPASKRIRFEETKEEEPKMSNREDLLNDLDDSDSDPEATAMMGGRKPVVVKKSQSDIVDVKPTVGPWVLSSSIDFGDIDQVADEEEDC